jgi:hypothetical protein
MNVTTEALVRLYAKLLHLYPARFRNEFAEEMQSVFRDSVNDEIKNGFFSFIVLVLRDVGGLPFNVLREFWHEFQGKELVMLRENTSGSSVTIGQVIMGILPFLLFSLVTIILELPPSLYEQDWFNSLGSYLFFIFLILPAIGFCIGWVRSFPRWSYPYFGMALIMAFYIRNGSTPGIILFGIPIFGRELWGWRAWIPLAAAFLIALIVSRSLKPLLRFFINLWNDWTIPSYLMVGVLPLLVWVIFDEMDRLYTLYFMVTFALLFAGMVILYLRSQTTGQRVVVLTVGVLIITFSAVLGTNSFWLEHNGIHPSGARNMLILAGKVALVMLLPTWLELIRRSIGRLRIA